MSARSGAGIVVLLASVGASRVAHATMVSGSDCLDLSTDCVCADGPYMSAYLDNQKAGLSAWEDTKSDVLDGQAKTYADAVALFKSKFMNDPRILEPFTQCSDFDPSKIAGTSISGGGAEINECFCQNVCRDIIEATIAHERTHVAFNILGISYIVSIGAACSANLVDQGFCDITEALLLSDSEIQAYGVGNQSLQAALDNLQDPRAPDMACTWEPLPAASPKEASAAPQPAGFFARFGALFGRFLRGADPSQP
jgi:hypothetical protein